MPKVARWGRSPARSPCPEPISWAASLGRPRPARCSVPAVETVPKEGFPDAETPPSPAASQLSESLCFLETRPRPVAGVDGLVRRGLAGGRSAGRLDTCRGCAGSLEPPAAGGGSSDRGQPGAEGPQRPPISSDSAAPSSPPLPPLSPPTPPPYPTPPPATPPCHSPLPPPCPSSSAAGRWCPGRFAPRSLGAPGAGLASGGPARDGGEIRGPRRGAATPGCARGPATPSRWRHGGPGVPRETAAALCGECPGADRGDRGRHSAGPRGNGSCTEGFVAPPEVLGGVGRGGVGCGALEGAACVPPRVPTAQKLRRPLEGDPAAPEPAVVARGCDTGLVGLGSGSPAQPSVTYAATTGIALGGRPLRDPSAWPPGAPGRSRLALWAHGVRAFPSQSVAGPNGARHLIHNRGRPGVFVAGLSSPRRPTDSTNIDWGPAMCQALCSVLESHRTQWIWSLPS